MAEAKIATLRGRRTGASLGVASGVVFLCRPTLATVSFGVNEETQL
jgi:hypothetical protein